MVARGELLFQPKFFKKPRNAFLRLVVMTVNDEDLPEFIVEEEGGYMPVVTMLCAAAISDSSLAMIPWT